MAGVSLGNGVDLGNVVTDKGGLILSNKTFDINSPMGTVIGTFSGKLPGTVLVMKPNTDGTLVVTGYDATGWGLAVGPTVSATSTSISIVIEERDIVTSSIQRSTPFVITVCKALPALPLATGAKVMGLGHSQIGNGTSTTASSGNVTSGYQSYTVGTLNWIRLLDDRFNLDCWEDPANPFAPVTGGQAFNGCTQGLSGDGVSYSNVLAAGILARLPYCIARSPDIIYLHIGTNDINVGATSDQIITLIDAVLTQIRAAGIWCIIQTEHQRNTTGTMSWSSTDPKRSVIDALNTWILTQSSRSGLKINDTTTLGFNTPFDSTLFQPVDGLHHTHKAGRIISGPLLTTLQSMVTAGNVSNLDPTSNNSFPSYGMLGTSGTKAGGITGNVATNYTATLTSGVGVSTVVASKEVISGSLEKQVFTITPATDALTPVYHDLKLVCSSAVMLSTLGASPGDWLEAYVYLELSAWDGWLEFYNRYTIGTSSTTVFTRYGGFLNKQFTGGVDLGIGTTGYAGWVNVGKFQVPSWASVDRVQTTGLPFYLAWSKNATGSGICKISQPILRKAVNSPKTAWNL